MTGAPGPEGYDGPAQILGKGRSVDVEVRLRGMFQPLDGHYHWYGRVAQDERVDALVEDVAGSRASVVLRTPDGEATARLADRDPWGRYRVTGKGPPPFDR